MIIPGGYKILIIVKEKDAAYGSVQLQISTEVVGFDSDTQARRAVDRVLEAGYKAYLLY